MAPEGAELDHHHHYIWGICIYRFYSNRGGAPGILGASPNKWRPLIIGAPFLAQYQIMRAPIIRIKPLSVYLYISHRDAHWCMQCSTNFIGASISTYINISFEQPPYWWWPNIIDKGCQICGDAEIKDQKRTLNPGSESGRGIRLGRWGNFH